MKNKFYLPFMLCAALSQLAVAQNSGNNTDGKTLFMKHCTRCHGEDGAKGKWGAPDLRRSSLGNNDLFNKISNGGWIMPRWKKTLSATEIQAIATYVKTLRH